jgi:hypothetical protein
MSRRRMWRIALAIVLSASAAAAQRGSDGDRENLRRRFAAAMADAGGEDDGSTAALRLPDGGVDQDALARRADQFQQALLAALQGDCPDDASCAAKCFERAAKEDRDLAFSDAIRDYDLLRRKFPSSRQAPQAEARAAELRAHGEGSFEPLRKLEHVRRDPRLASEPEAIDRLVADAETFPPGRVRIEAWSLAAEAYAHRLGAPEKALPLYRRVVENAKDDPVAVRLAAREAIGILAARGDLAGAEEMARLAHDADPKIESDVARLVRRHRLHFASIAVLVCAAAMAAAAWIAAARAGAIARVTKAARRIAPLALGYAAYVGAAGALLASSYEAGTAKPFLWFGVALGPLLLLARAWSAAGRSTRGARSLRAVVCAAAALATAFLVLERIDVAYLEGLGL